MSDSSMLLRSSRTAQPRYLPKLLGARLRECPRLLSQLRIAQLSDTGGPHAWCRGRRRAEPPNPPRSRRTLPICSRPSRPLCLSRQISGRRPYGNGLAIASRIDDRSSDDLSALQIAMGRNDIVEGVGAVWANVENALANGIEQVGGAGRSSGARCGVCSIARQLLAEKAELRTVEFATLERHFGRRPRSRRWESAGCRRTVQNFRPVLVLHPAAAPAHVD
jgi:hypothetical protein